MSFRYLQLSPEFRECRLSTPVSSALNVSFKMLSTRKKRFKWSFSLGSGKNFRSLRSTSYVFSKFYSTQLIFKKMKYANLVWDILFIKTKFRLLIMKKCAPLASCWCIAIMNSMINYINAIKLFKTSMSPTREEQSGKANVLCQHRGHRLSLLALMCK